MKKQDNPVASLVLVWGCNAVTRKQSQSANGKVFKLIEEKNG